MTEMVPNPAPVGPPQPTPSRRGRLRGRLSLPVALLLVTAAIVVLDPRRLIEVLRQFPLRWLPLVMALSAGYYLLQGLRWHLLLRTAGIHLRLRDAELLNTAGQATGLLPLGELTRAVLVSEVSGAPLGAAIATITVQELLHAVVVVGLAVPGAIAHPVAIPIVVGALLVSVGVLAVTALPRIAEPALGGLRRIPVLRRLGTQAYALHMHTAALLRHPATWLGTVLSLVAALLSVTMFWTVVQQLHPGLLSWGDAAFVLAVASLAGMVSLAPGGLVGFEAATVALLILLGASPATAFAAALLQRGADKGLATVAGVIALGAARRRFVRLRIRVEAGGTDQLPRSERRSA